MSTSRYCRCGIYTRQSRKPEGEFTSCQAQFEACFEFLRAQFGEGWVYNGRRYDDEGGSSESLDRPGLGHLLTDIDAGKVDRVVIHRLDRLSRSIVATKPIRSQNNWSLSPAKRGVSARCFTWLPKARRRRRSLRLRTVDAGERRRE